MSCKNDFLPIRSRKQRCLLDSSSSQRAGPSTRTWHPRNYSSTSLPPYSSSPQADLDNLLDPLDDITLDNDLDQRSASSVTLLSHRVSPSLPTNPLFSDANHASSEFDLSSRLSESRQSCFLYPLHEPGQMTAQRTQRLRARTAAVIKSLPATSEEVVDVDEHEPRSAVEAPPGAQAPKLRRVSCVRDLRRAFRDGEHGPVHFASISSLGVSKASYELGILASPAPPLSPLSPRSSLRTLVDSGNALPQSSGDLKTLCQSTFSSISIASRFPTKVHSSLPLSRPSHTRLPSDTSQSIFRGKYPVHNPLTPQPHRRHTSLQLDTPLSRPPGKAVWSCAKISQSTVKRAARRGHPPRRVFSSPIAALPS
ncbi:hypothetical protein OG21DRAFT_1601009 [Imleria badia]|nr:hypothetical protein OG21DRAFT_1601009 [Imleria badia]